MAYDPEIHHRHSFRLRGYDYARAGLYCLTLCTYGQEHTFGDVVESEMRLNDTGRLVEACWRGLPRHYPYVRLDEFAVMPNHVHGIIELMDVGAGLRPAPAPAPPRTSGPVLKTQGVAPIPRAGRRPAPTSLKRHGVPEIVRSFKTLSALQINGICGTSGVPVWQRNYYERIIRNRKELEMIRDYIRTNPARWDKDPERWVDVGAGPRPAPRHGPD